MQNTSSDSTTWVTRHYYNASGTLVHSTGAAYFLYLRAKCFYLPVEGVGTGFYSLQVTRSAAPIAGIHNLARLDSACANPTTLDYGASYNLPQR